MKRTPTAALLFFCYLFFPATSESAEPKPTYDVVIYGGTSAAVTAAVQAKKMDRSVVVVSPDTHLGGLSSGGLGWTDTGNKTVIGGLSREFYHRVYLHYDTPEAWNWQDRASYGNRGQGNRASDGKERTMWIFEPHVAEKIFEDFVREYEIPVHRNQWLDRKKGVKLDGKRIAEITMLSGETYRGKMFIDATYEGDLMATAGVSYHVGREATSVYDEKWNGVQTGVLHHGHHFGVLKTKIDPYKTPGDPSSGVLPGISTKPPGEYGAGDHRIQAYCFRMCLTNKAENRIPFPKPEGYDPAQYELAARVFDAGWRQQFGKFDPLPNYKTDTNNHGPFSTDNIGANYEYPEGSYERRREIIAQHRQYQQGLMYYLANDERVPAEVRTAMSKWGLPKDEFTDNGNWSHQIYVREARRMIGDFVMTENELLKKRPTPQSIGMGSYTMDSHNVQRYIVKEDKPYVQNEGDIGVSTQGPYEIAFGSILPKAEECENLLVPVCVSSSHIAFGSIRMEPVFMILGQSAATTASMAIENNQAVQEVDYDKLRARLLADGQILETSQAVGSRENSRGTDAAKLAGVVIDDRQAKLTGSWTLSSSTPGWVEYGYQHNGEAKELATAEFSAKLKPGKYEVRLSYPAHDNRASNVEVIVHAGKDAVHRTVNQKKEPAIDGLFHSLGEFEFGAEGKVTISTRDADGYVIIDAVQFIAK